MAPIRAVSKRLLPPPALTSSPALILLHPLLTPLGFPSLLSVYTCSSLGLECSWPLLHLLFQYFVMYPLLQEAFLGFYLLQTRWLPPWSTPSSLPSFTAAQATLASFTVYHGPCSLKGGCAPGLYSAPPTAFLKHLLSVGATIASASLIISPTWSVFKSFCLVRQHPSLRSWGHSCGQTGWAGPGAAGASGWGWGLG